MQGLTILLMVAVAYLFYKVYRLERMLEGPGRSKAKAARPRSNTKVVPLLRSNLPRGPFAPDRRKDDPPQSDRHS